MKIIAYRKKSSGKGQIGAGTFYYLTKPPCFSDIQLKTFDFSFAKNELLDIYHKHVTPFDGLPSEFLAGTWFPGMTGYDWQKKAHELGFDESGAAMDVLVAQEAKRRGLKAIKYGNIELQVIE